MTVYLSGKITGKADYANSFMFWSGICERQGMTTINPCFMPEGLTPTDYMRVSIAQIEAADAILMLPDWKESKGAIIEKLYAEYIGKKVLYARHKIVTECRGLYGADEYTIPEIVEDGGGADGG